MYLKMQDRCVWVCICSACVCTVVYSPWRSEYPLAVVCNVIYLEIEYAKIENE